MPKKTHRKRCEHVHIRGSEKGQQCTVLIDANKKYCAACLRRPYVMAKLNKIDPKLCTWIFQSGLLQGQPCGNPCLPENQLCQEHQLKSDTVRALTVGVEPTYCQCWAPNGELRPCLTEVKAGEKYCDTCKENPKPLPVITKCKGTVPGVNGMVPCRNSPRSGDDFCSRC